MSTAQAPPASPTPPHVQSLPRLLLALGLVFVPIGVASYASVVSHYRSDEAPGFFVVTILPVLFYLVAFLVSAPDVLGLQTRKGSALLERWSALFRWTSVLVAAATFLFWLLATTFAAFSPDTTPPPHSVPELVGFLGRLVVVLGVSCFAFLVILTAPFAGQELLAPTSRIAEAPYISGWRAMVFTWHARSARWLLKLCTARFSVLFGTIAILASLILPMDLDGSLFQSTGYSVLLGKSTLPTAVYTVRSLTARSIVMRAEQAMYLLALLTALVALTFFVLGKRGTSFLRHRLLSFLSGAVALFVTTDLAFAYVRFFTTQDILGGQTDAQRIIEKFLLILWPLLSCVCLALWVKAGRLQDSATDRLCIVAMLLLIPPFFFALFFLPSLVGTCSGIATVWIGSLFLYWGFLQTRQPAAAP